MELLKVTNESFHNEEISEYLGKWNLLAFREGKVEPSPITLVYSAPADEVLSKWSSLVDDVALHIQANLDKKERRNLSLIFITSALPQISVREIRDNTYCCKKVVLEASGTNALQELNRYYLGDHSKSHDSLNGTHVRGPFDQPLSTYIIDKHPEIKQIMSQKI